MIDFVCNAYVANCQDPPIKPLCHNVPRFPINTIGKRLYSVYGSRLAVFKKFGNCQIIIKILAVNKK